MNRFRGLDLVNSVPELGTMICILYRSSVQNHPKEKEKQEGKWLSEDSLQIVEERSEKQGEKGNIHPTKCRVPKNNKKKQVGLLQ